MPVSIWKELIIYLPPIAVVLLVVIWWLFKSIERRDKLLSDGLAENTKILTTLTTLIDVMVHGGQR